MDIPVDLYVRQNPVPNAYTMAIQVPTFGRCILKVVCSEMTS